jgi:hypothetical protein
MDDFWQNRTQDYQDLFRSVLKSKQGTYIPLPQRLEGTCIQALRTTHAKQQRVTSESTDGTQLFGDVDATDTVTVIVHDFTRRLGFNGYNDTASTVLYDDKKDEGMPPVTLVLPKLDLATLTWKQLTVAVREKLSSLDVDESSETSANENSSSDRGGIAKWKSSAYDLKHVLFHPSFDLCLLKEPPVPGQAIACPVWTQALTSTDANTPPCLADIISKHVTGEGSADHDDTTIIHVNVAPYTVTAGKAKLAPDEMATCFAAAHELAKAMPRLLDCVMLKAKICSRNVLTRGITPNDCAPWLPDHHCDCSSDDKEKHGDNDVCPKIFRNLDFLFLHLLGAICFSRWWTSDASNCDLDMMSQSVISNADMRLSHHFADRLTTLKKRAEAIVLRSTDPEKLLVAMYARIESLEKETADSEKQRQRESTMYDGVYKALGFVGKNAGHRLGSKCKDKDQPPRTDDDMQVDDGDRQEETEAGLEEVEVAVQEEADIAMKSLIAVEAARAAETAASIMARNERMHAALVRLRAVKDALMKDNSWGNLVKGGHNAGFCLEQSQLLPLFLNRKLLGYSAEHRMAPIERVVNELLALAEKSKDMSESNRKCLNQHVAQPSYYGGYDPDDY